MVKINFVRPYKDNIINQSVVLRKFDQDIDPKELMWHRDKEDRIIEPIESTDWKFQIDNKLPITIDNKIFIPKHVWHRAIKGTGSLTLKITKFDKPA